MNGKHQWNSGNEIKYIQDAFDSNWVTSIGGNIDAFENDLKLFFERDNQVVALNSCTSVIHLALVMLGVQSGDEVITQSMTFCGSTNPIAYQGATPIFVDSEKDTWNICPIALEEAMPKFTQLIPIAFIKPITNTECLVCRNAL